MTSSGVASHDRLSSLQILRFAVKNVTSDRKLLISTAVGFVNETSGKHQVTLIKLKAHAAHVVLSGWLEHIQYM